MRPSVRLLLASSLLGFLLSLPGPPQPLKAQPADLAVSGVTLTVDDLERAVAFYRDVLSFTPVDTLTARGRPIPRDTNASDLWHAHVHLQTAQLEETIDALLNANTPFVSPGLVSLPASTLGPASAAMMRDPTGHALLLSPPSTDTP